MHVSLFGLGHVGCVTAACLARDGHSVCGVDVNADKVAMMNDGTSPIIERGLAEIIAEQHCAGALRATTDPRDAVLNSDISVVCVGTPRNGNGSLDLRAIATVAGQIGESLGGKTSYHCVVIRSTVLPGTVRNVIVPIVAEASHKTAHVDFDVCFSPEFLREGCAIDDFRHPPFTVTGRETCRGRDAVTQLYGGVAGTAVDTSYEVAEMLKYVCNSYHALKVTFANEVGTLCKEIGIDGHEVMALFCRDGQLNVSAAYLEPGFAFGGSCLGKDLQALLYRAKELDVEAPVLRAVLESNERHVGRAVARIRSTGHRRVGILGLSFKAGTDDLRDSPTVALVEVLIGRGYQVKIFDPDVGWARIFGANRSFIERELPHVGSLVCESIEEVIEGSELLVISKRGEAMRRALEPHLARKPMLDLVRMFANHSGAPATYDGICW